MAKVDRAMIIIRAMTNEERAELLDILDADYCQDCGAELPEPEQPGHECPFDTGEDEDETEGEEDGQEDERTDDERGADRREADRRSDGGAGQRGQAARPAAASDTRSGGAGKRTGGGPRG